MFYIVDVKSQNPRFVEPEIVMTKLENIQSKIVGTAEISSHYALVDKVKMGLSTIERYGGRREVKDWSKFSRGN